MIRAQFRRRGLVSLLLWGAGGILAFPLPALAATLIISELSPGTTAAGTEFVEIYNTTNAPITIDATNFKLKFISSTNAITNKTLTFINTTVPAKGYFLFASFTSLGTSGGVSVNADATFASGLAATRGGVAITDNFDVKFDSVGYSSMTADATLTSANETQSVDNANVTIPNGWTIERKANSLSTATSMWTGGADVANGNSRDTDNNNSDFVVYQSSWNPQNSLSATEPYPAAPAGLTVAVAGDGFADLKWTASTEADLKDYRVYRSTNAGVTQVSSHVVTTVLAPGTTHRDAGLTNTTTFYYRLEARDTLATASALSVEVSTWPRVGPDTTPPATPTGLAAADVGGDQGTALNLTWTANTEGDMKDYRIFRSTNGNVTVGSSWTVTLAVIAFGGTTHQDAGLTPVTTYYFKITARDTTLNESAASGEVNLRPVDNLAPTAPGGVTVGDPGTTVLNLNWTVNTESDVREYLVYRSTNAGVTLVSTHVVVYIVSPGTTYQDSGLTTGRRYNYRVTARDNSTNESAGSTEVSGVPGAPAAPTGVGVADVPSDQGFALRLSWNANTEADLKDYRVLRATSNPYFSSVDTARIAAPGTTHQDGGLTNGSTYYYVVFARDTSLNEGAGSAGLPQAYPVDNLAPAVPTGLGIADVAWDSGTALSLSWTANTEADLKDYGVYRATFGGVLGTKALVTRIAAAGTTHQDAALGRGATYYYQLTARDVSTNESGGGTEVSALTVDNWLREPVDTTVASVGRRVQVAVDQTGAMHLAYYSNTDSAIKYAKKTGGSWTLETVDTGIGDAGGFGAFVGLAVNAAGTPYVVYATSGGASADALKFGYKTGGTWSTSTVESGQYAECSLALDGAGNAHAAYRAGSALKYGKWTGASWSTATVDAAAGSYTGITVEAGGQVDISYNSSVNVLKHARSTDNGATWGAPTTVDGTTGSWADETAIAVSDTGTIHIAYYDTGPFDLAYAQYNGAAWSTGTLESAGSVGDYPDITLDASGNPMVSYLQSTNGETKLARWTGSAWERTVVSTSGVGGGEFTGLEFTPDGKVHIFYRAGSQLWHAQSAATLGAPALVQMPSGLYTSTWSATSITWNWTDNATNETGYRVRTSTHLNVSGALAANAVSWAESSLTPNTTSTRYAQAFNSGEVGNSTTSTRVTLANPPSGTAVSSVSSTTATLAWALNGNPSNTWFQMQRSTFDGGYATIVSTAGSPYTDTGLLGASTYYYRLRARNWEDQFSAFDSTVSAVTNPDSTPPSAPTGLGLTDPGTTVLNLSWTANTEPDLRDYRVYRSTNAGVTVVSSHVVTAILTPGTTHQDAGLTTGRQYFYRIASRDRSLNETGGTGEVNGVPGAPGVVALPGVADVPGDQGTALNLSWASNAEADLKDYRVHRSTNNLVTVGSSWTITLAAIVQPGTTHQDTGLSPVTTYYYKVTARDSSLNESSASTETNLRPVDNSSPTAPGVPTVADVPSDQGFALRLNWTLNTETDVREYGVYRSTNGNGVIGSSWTVLVTLVLSPGTTRQDNGLTNGATYYYKVTARDTSGNESGLSTEASAIPADNLAPTAPGVPTVADVPSDQGFALRLNWALNTEADMREYGVYRSTNGNGVIGSSWTVLVTLVLSPGTTRQDGGLTNAATYYYKLSARDTSGNESGLSAESSAIPVDNLAPGTPVGIGVTNAGSGAGGAFLNLSWSSNGEADLKDYRVYRSTLSGVTQVSSHVITAIAAPGTTHQDRALTTGTTYFYRLSARDATGNESGLSAEVSVFPSGDITPPATPTGLAVADVGGDQGVALNLSWAANGEPDLKDYRVHRSTNGNVTVNSSWTVTLATLVQPGTTHQDAGLSPVTTYYYKITARDTSLNESGASSEVNARPLDNLAPAAPGVPTVADVPSDQGFALRLNWTLNTETDVREYGVYRSTNNNVTAGSTWTVLTTLVLSPGTTRQDGGLTNGATYYYKLSARDTSGNESGLSTEASAIPYDNVAPATPTAPGAADVPSDQGFALRLSWSANTEPDLKDYAIYRTTFTPMGSSPPLMARILPPGTTHQDGGLTNGTTYYYGIAARDVSLNEQAPSTEVSAFPVDNLAPAAPAGLAVGDPGTTVLNLNWTANTEADRKDYRVFRSTNAGVTLVSSHVVTAVASPGTTHQDGGLTAGTRYNYRLTARDVSLNESGGSSEVSGVPGAPGTPAGVGASNTAGGANAGARLSLSWTANTEADLKEYAVYRATYSGATGLPFLVRVAAPGTTHQDPGLTNLATYYYRLTGRDASGNEGGLSADASAYPQDTVAPVAPSGLGVTVVGAVSLNLSWTANTEGDLKDYRVYRSTNAGVTQVSSLVVTGIAAPGTTHQDGGLAQGTTYYYKISARDTSLNESGFSSEASGTTAVDITPPAIPGGVGISNTVGGADAGTRLTLSWTANTEGDLKDYRVYRSTNAGVTQVSSHVVTAIPAPGTTHQDGGLANGTTYFYKLSARDLSLNESGLSTQVSAYPNDVIAPAAPAGFGASNATGGAAVGGRLSLSWTANTEGDLKDYRLFRSTFTGALGTKAVLATVVAPGTTHQDAGLTNGTTLYYQATARDVIGNESGGSVQASAYAADSTAPTVPAGLGVANPAIGLRLNMSWTANTESDLKDYRVFRSTNGNVTIGSSWTVTLAAIVQPGTTHQDAGLANGTTYFYRLTARDATTNESGLSSEVSGTPTDTTAPAIPAGLATTDVPGDQGVALRLNWTANTETDLKDYRLWRGAASGPIGTKSNIAVIAAPGSTHQDGGLVAGTTYYYQLTARDQTGNESAGSGEISGYPQDNLAPSSPTAFGVAVVSSGTRLNLSWAANTEADLKDYRAWRGLASGSIVTKSSIAAIAAPGTTHQDAGLVNGTTYYYQVTARDVSFNESAGATESSGTPQDTLAPAAPAGLGVAFSGIASRINLSWTANTESDLKDYRVRRTTFVGVGIADPVVAMIATPGTTHQDGGLAVTTYYYRLTARDLTVNESGLSAEASANTTDTTAPANPIGLGVADVPADQGGALRLSWTANTEGDLKDYRIWRALASGPIGTKTTDAIIAAPGTTHQDAGLTNGTTYYYQLTARDTSGNESAGGSGESSAYPSDNIAPGTPTGLGVAAVVSGTLRLSWIANTESDLKDYRIHRSTNGNVTVASSWTVVAAVISSPGTTHQDGGLTKGTTYYYRLTARDAGLNESGVSPEVSGAPPLIAPPAGLGVSDPGTGPLNLSWTANTETDLKDYRVYRSTNAGVTLVSSHVVTAVAAPGTTHQDGGLTAGTRYNYRLTARDVSLNESGGNGETSGQPGAPAAPALLGAADAVTGSGLNLSWAAGAEIDLKDYRLYRSTSGNVTAGSSWTVVAATVAAPGTTHQDGGLASGTVYSYRLSARDIGLNESPLSSLASAIPTVPAPVVTPPTPSAPPTTAVTATVSVSAPAGGSAELKTVLEPGKSSRIDGDVITLKSTGAVPGNTIEVRIVNTKTNATQTVSVKVDAQGNWSVPTPKLADGTYEIQVRQVDPATGLASNWSPDKPFVVVVNAVPDQTVAIPAGPNPFRPGRGVSMAIGFELQEAANVTVSIHMPDGALVKTLVDERALGPGKYERGPSGDTAAGWDGTNESGQVVSSGIYLIKIKMGNRVFSRKILLIR